MCHKVLVKSNFSQSNMAVKKGKVLVGMSGGVDSSVAACLLKDQGYDVIGIHLRFWTDPTIFSEEEKHKFPQNKCCTLEGLSKTRRIAHKLCIPFYVLNFEDAFKTEVIDYFIEGYQEGITPNPCVECNRTIKFGLFLQKMRELGADYVATGHYARVRKNKNGEYELLAAKDITKDQSYFLYTLTQEKLKHILFPIGEYTKKEVRELAKKYGINEVNNQKESQNLCFFPEKTHEPFLQRHLKKQDFKPGPIMTSEGDIIGQHKGLPNYTIGQRKGLGIGGLKGYEYMEGESWYVIRLDREQNAVIVGQYKHLFHPELEAHTLSFVNGEEPLKEMKVEAKIRARFPRQPARFFIKNGAATVQFEKAQRAITPGQSVVLYDGEKVLGGGVIK